LQQGTITPPLGSQHTLSPAIAVNSAGEVALIFTLTGPDDPPGIWATGRSVCDAANQMAPIVEIRSGVSCIDTGQSTPGDPNRWGDYPGVVALPDGDGDRFWAVGQYATRVGTASWWNTHIQELEVIDQCASCTCSPTNDKTTHPFHR
jgi:hypothetical protein